MTDFHYKIMRAAEDGEKFYAKVGHFLASKAVRKEIGGYPIDNEPDWTWIVAQEKRTFGVVGFISLAPAGDTLEIRVFYVEEKYRKQHVATTLIEKAEHYAKHEGYKAISANVTGAGHALLEKLGYVAVRERGNWRIMKKGVAL